LVAQGGLRGRGNREFSTARSSEPKRFEHGKSGYEADIYLELKLTADIGLVGFPNVGKSSLLNSLTKSKSKVANYNFTTLEPHLGVLPDGSIMADIPGIIEGASDGKGLGAKFLRHIQRTRLILHCITASSVDPVRDYEIIRNELIRHSSGLENKPELVLLTKTDLVDGKSLSSIKSVLKKRTKRDVMEVTVVDDGSVAELLKSLTEALKRAE